MRQRGLAAASGSSTAVSRAEALHALALSCVQLGELEDAQNYLEEGLREARAAGLTRHRAELEATSAQLLFHAERPSEAFSVLDAALADLASSPGDADPGEARARLLGQRAYLCFRTGHHEEGLADSAEALRACPQDGRAATTRARVLCNRGLALLEAGQPAEARGDLEEALGIHRAVGADVLAAQVLNNLGCVATGLGDVPDALRLFDEALAEHVRLGLPAHHVMVDRARLLATARLFPEARTALAEAATALAAEGLAADAAEAWLSLAETCLSDGDPAPAVQAAETARAAFRRQGRTNWVARALDIPARASRALLDPDTDALALYESYMQSAGRLRAAGWRQESFEAAVRAGRAALHLGRVDLIEAAVGTLRPAGGPEEAAHERAVMLEGRALASLARGEREEAIALLRRALEAAFGAAVELGAASAQPGHGGAVDRLSQLGLSIATAEHSAVGALEWGETCRLRGPLHAQDEPYRAAELERHLRARRAVVFFATEGRLLAVVGPTLELVELGALAPAEKAAAALRFSLCRLSTRRRSESRAHRMELARLCLRSARDLDDILGLDGLVPGPEPFSLVPTGRLWQLPWAVLPSLARRPFALAPGAAFLPPPAEALVPRRVLLVAGPGLKTAEEEVRRVAERCYPGQQVETLHSSEATVEAVLQGLRHSDLAHLAVHGRFRVDNPYMSSLVCADGEVTVHELSRLDHRPRTVVLSACESGRIGAHPGGELAGTGPALLALGSREATPQTAVVGAVVPLSDEAMPEVAEALHHRLGAGDDPATALASARCRETLVDLSSDEIAEPSSRAARAVALVSLVAYQAGRAVPSGTEREALGE